MCEQTASARSSLVPGDRSRLHLSLLKPAEHCALAGFNGVGEQSEQNRRPAEGSDHRRFEIWEDTAPIALPDKAFVKLAGRRTADP